MQLKTSICNIRSKSITRIVVEIKWNRDYRNERASPCLFRFATFVRHLIRLSFFSDNIRKPSCTDLRTFRAMCSIQIENQSSDSKIHVGSANMGIGYNLCSPWQIGHCEPPDKLLRKTSLIPMWFMSTDKESKLMEFQPNKEIVLTVLLGIMLSACPSFWSQARDSAVARPAFRYWCSPWSPSCWPFSNSLSKSDATWRGICKRKV